MSALKNTALGVAAIGWLVLAVTLLPASLAVGFWLLGFQFDWSSWKTYVGLEVISLAMVFLTK